MSLSEYLKNLIIQNLKAIDPDQVILFGSHAWGDPTEESDIDLYDLNSSFSREIQFKGLKLYESGQS